MTSMRCTCLFLWQHIHSILHTQRYTTIIKTANYYFTHMLYPTPWQLSVRAKECIINNFLLHVLKNQQEMRKGSLYYLTKTHTQVYKHIYIDIYLYTPIHTDTYIHRHTVHIYTLTHICTYTHTYKHQLIYIHN